MLHLRDSRKNLRFANGKQLQLRLEKREEPVNESARHASGCRSRNMAEDVYLCVCLDGGKTGSGRSCEVDERSERN